MRPCEFSAGICPGKGDETSSHPSLPKYVRVVCGIPTAQTLSMERAVSSPHLPLPPTGRSERTFTTREAAELRLAHPSRTGPAGMDRQ